MEDLNHFIESLNKLLFHPNVVYALLFTGIIFTIWSGFGQYRALTHGVSVVRGKFDKKSDPGAINHFQALSAALSATVGLGNIAGVALAVALGGPGAIFWMWIIGILGMALKMTEVTQSMMFRNTDDPKNPHGGPMFVVDSLLKDKGGRLGTVIGGIFCCTLILSAITGGNMFQAWSVADVTTTYFTIPGLGNGDSANKNFNPETLAIGILLAIIVGSVIVGGIKRIGAVAGRIVPLMCGLYLAAGLVVLAINIADIPGLIMLIITSGLGLEEASLGGAFIGGTFGSAMMWGIKRALFSSEAGQGSAPIAHSAAKCDEPVREGVVAGLEPFIDTIVVCTITALIILSSGAWNRPAEAEFPESAQIQLIENNDGWTLDTPALPHKTEDAKRINRVSQDKLGWKHKDSVFAILELQYTGTDGKNLEKYPKPERHRIPGKVVEVKQDTPDDTGAVGGAAPSTYTVKWETVDFPLFLKDEDGKPTRMPNPDLVATLVSPGVFVDYKGASMTAHAFDRVIPGLGMWLVVPAAWLFAISTMISWSYYGEQGIYYFFGKGIACDGAVVMYRLVYAILIAVSTIGFIRTDEQLDMWTTMGLGAMLVANIPIMWIFSVKSMKAYHTYIGKLKRGEFHPHKAPHITDVVTGHDVEE